MRRFAVLAALALAALAPDRAAAQPALPGSIQIVEAKAEKDKLTWSDNQLVPVQKTVPVEVVVNGKKVLETRTVTEYQTVAVTRSADLKALKATDAAGKAIDADKLAELLKEKTAVVVVPGPLPEKHRALFKDATVFVELPAAKGPGPLPVPVAPAAPAVAPAVVVPPPPGPPVAVPAPVAPPVQKKPPQ